MKKGSGGRRRAYATTSGGRPARTSADRRLPIEVIVSRSPSYPCEHSVVAGAAAAVLDHLFRADAQRLAAAAHEAAWSRVVAGAVYPSDSRAGLDLGRAVAGRVVALASQQAQVHYRPALPNQPNSTSAEGVSPPSPVGTRR